MSKLSAIKGYLSESEASQYLSKALDESVSLGQIYELCLEGHLTVSAKFIKKAFAVRKHDASASLDTTPAGNCDDDVKVLDGIWDLAMIGDELQDIRHRYQEESHQTYPVCEFVRGLHFKRDNEVYKVRDVLKFAHSDANKARLNEILSSQGYTEEDLYERSLAYQVFESLTDNEIDEVLSLSAALESDDGFDKDDEVVQLETPVHQLVFRVSELDRLIHYLNSNKSSDSKEVKPLTAKEKNSYLILINAMLKDMGFDPSTRGIASSLVKMTELCGTALSENTIRKILGEINDIKS
ncbi:hypothetical protein ST37_16355 [Vibrio sp. qd031]|uniref:hypothetical protein n=1 Tax=Vibrio sp. qd031 TaxID=1603038 RepID=UPI000A114942|nr:hypothetical protein [Vibrio sp. qd031]ORT48954.1 hypothetical protein ST37_16355 [Vibrio sp. qd031]